MNNNKFIKKCRSVGMGVVATSVLTTACFFNSGNKKQAEQEGMLNFDKNLVTKIDSMEKAGLPEDRAVEKSLVLSWNNFAKDLPESPVLWSSEQKHMAKHICDLVEKSREEKIDNELVLAHSCVNGAKRVSEERVVHYIYNPNFKNELRKNIGLEEKQLDQIKLLSQKKNNAR